VSGGDVNVPVVFRGFTLPLAATARLCSKRAWGKAARPRRTFFSCAPGRDRKALSQLTGHFRCEIPAIDTCSAH